MSVQEDSKLTPFQCQQCKKSFGKRGDLNRHINNVHKKLTPFQCLECKKYFKRKTHHQIHINKVHKMEDFILAKIKVEKLKL